MPNVQERCNRCGKIEVVPKMSYEPSVYYLCATCKAQSERTPKQLMKSLGESVRPSWKSATEKIEESKKRRS